MALAISFIADSLKLRIHVVCGLGCLPPLQIKLGWSRSPSRERTVNTKKARSVNGHLDCKNDHCGLLNASEQVHNTNYDGTEALGFQTVPELHLVINKRCQRQYTEHTAESIFC